VSHRGACPARPGGLTMHAAVETPLFTSRSLQVREPDPPPYGGDATQQKQRARRRLAGNVRLLRVMRGWSQETLALAAGLDRTYVGAIERAERNLTLDNIEKLAEALGEEVTALLS